MSTSVSRTEDSPIDWDFDVTEIQSSPVDEITVLDYDVHTGQPLPTPIATVTSNISVLDDEKIRMLAEEQIRMIKESESKPSAVESREPSQGSEKTGFVLNDEIHDNYQGYHKSSGPDRNNNYSTFKRGQPRYAWNKNDRQPRADRKENDGSIKRPEFGFGHEKSGSSRGQSRGARGGRRSNDLRTGTNNKRKHNDSGSSLGFKRPRIDYPKDNATFTPYKTSGFPRSSNTRGGYQRREESYPNLGGAFLQSRSSNPHRRDDIGSRNSSGPRSSRSIHFIEYPPQSSMDVNSLSSFLTSQIQQDIPKEYSYRNDGNNGPRHDKSRQYNSRNGGRRDNTAFGGHQKQGFTRSMSQRPSYV
uniref:Uncharacterized protein n=1 Tax=Panagrolaimus sp. JU765 TaxID=591449 RepID=A0AC34RDE7_9BILA